MKRRDLGEQPRAGDELSRRQAAQLALTRALASVDSPELMADFLIDLCTPAELEALADRWSVVPLLADGVSYRQVHEQTGVSVTTVGRVARCLEHGTGGYREVLTRSRGGVDAQGRGVHAHTGGVRPAHG